MIGAVAGGLAGNAIGAVLDEEERRQLALATQQAAASAPVGKRVAWSGVHHERKETGRRAGGVQTAPTTSSKASGWVMPTTEKYQASDGRTCRDLEQFAEKEGKSYQQKVTACKTKSGWEIPT